MSQLRTSTEEVVVNRGTPLRLSFAPQAIREHFACCKEAGRRLAALSDETLAEIGLMALESDAIETAFNQSLRTACEELEGFDPEGD